MFHPRSCGAVGNCGVAQAGQVRSASGRAVGVVPAFHSTRISGGSMATSDVEWQMAGEYLKNCSCAPGCPCDFWAAPTHHLCEGMCGMLIKQGHFGKTRLDGLKWA